MDGSRYTKTGKLKKIKWAISYSRNGYTNFEVMKARTIEEVEEIYNVRRGYDCVLICEFHRSILNRR